MEYTLFNNAFLLTIAIIGIYMVFRAGVNDKVEHFFLIFHVMAGDLNTHLTFKIPGVSFFEIQPERFLFFLLLFYICRKLFLRQPHKMPKEATGYLPWFMIFMFLNIGLWITSMFWNSSIIGMSDVIVYAVNGLTFILVIYAIRMMATRKTFELIGMAFVVGGLFTCLISFVQIGIDPAFMRVGDFRQAFGNVLRVNGTFNAEYMNAYYLTMAIAWILVTMKNSYPKYILIAIFVFTIFLTFHRMSWLILLFLLFIYFVFYERPSLDKLVLSGLTGVAAIVLILVLFMNDIMNSTIVKDRLTDHVDGRKGYYSMVFDNIGNEPIFGFGGMAHRVYYREMMIITKSRERAEGVEGGIHSGYFDMLFFYGLPCFLTLVCFMFFTIIYFGRLTRYHLFFVIPFYVVFIYAVGNLTNTLLYTRNLSVLVAIHIGIGLSARYMKEYFSQPELSPPRAQPTATINEP